MNILKKHPLPALLLLAVLVLAGYLAFLIPSGYQLQLRDRKADELIAAWPIAPGDKLSLEIEHSFEHIPWYEYYSVTDGLEFNLDAIAVAGYGAGIPARWTCPPGWRAAWCGWRTSTVSSPPCTGSPLTST